MVHDSILLDHMVFERGIEVDKAKVEVIEKMQPPILVKGVYSFLGHTSFCRPFIRDFSKIAKPLTYLLSKDVPFIFDQACLDGFCRLKEALPPSNHTSSQLEFTL